MAYCKTDCQKSHWAEHKPKCQKPFAVKESKKVGRYMVATRDLKPGEMIISETPLVIGPQAVTIPVCLACYKPATNKYL